MTYGEVEGELGRFSALEGLVRGLILVGGCCLRTADDAGLGLHWSVSLMLIEHFGVTSNWGNNQRQSCDEFIKLITDHTSSGPYA